MGTYAWNTLYSKILPTKFLNYQKKKKTKCINLMHSSTELWPQNEGHENDIYTSISRSYKVICDWIYFQLVVLQGHVHPILLFSKGFSFILSFFFFFFFFWQAIKGQRQMKNENES